MKFLFLLMVIPVMLVSQAGILPEVFSEANVVQFYNNGQEFSISESDQSRFDELFVDAISGSHQMPAFAVAIHKLTMQDFKEGYWVKFDYGKTMTASKMNFDQLLIHIQPNSYGVNIIRGNNGKFDGRCYYLDLEKTLDDVYDFLVSVERVEEEKLEVEIEKGEESEVKEVEEESDPQPDKDTSGDGNGNDKSSAKESENKKESSATTDEEVKNVDVKENIKSESLEKKIEENTEALASESKIPSVNDERKEENKVIKQEATERVDALTEICQEKSEMPEEVIEEEQEEKATASSVLMEAVSQFDEE